MTYDKLIEDKKKYEKTLDILQVQLNMMSGRSEKIDVAARIIKLAEKLNVLDMYWAAESQEAVDKIKSDYIKFCAEVDYLKEYLIFEAAEAEPTATIVYTKKISQILSLLVQYTGIQIRKIKVLKRTGEWIIAA